MRAATLVLALSGCAVPSVVGTLAADSGAPMPLSSAPVMTIAAVQQHAQGVSIAVEPVVGALDYRVYVMPRAEDVSDDGIIRDGLYRCAGDREAPRVPTDGEPMAPGGAITTLLTSAIQGHPYQRTIADATLGHVMTHAGAGLTAVYVLGDRTALADTSCYFHRFASSRIKRFTTSITERDELLADGWRDDGIAFYVPETASAETRTIHRLSRADGMELVLSEGPELDAITDASPLAIFEVLTNAEPGSVPLTRIFYSNLCARPHDELAAGRAAFAHTVSQGSFAVPHLHWPNATEPTTLVVEALDQGCPFQGHYSPEHRDAWAATDTRPAHQPWLTLAEARAASPSREVFLNGQHEAGNRPHAIARAIIEVAPLTEPAMEWEAAFDAPLVVPAPVAFPTPASNNFAYDLTDYDVRFYQVDQQAIGVELGELWISYADNGAGSESYFTLTPRTDAQLSDDSFVHARMDVDIVTSETRYPQLYISDRPIPTHESFDAGWTVMIHPFGKWPSGLRIALCDHVVWDTSDGSCDVVDVAQRPDGGWAPTLPVAELAGVDRTVRFDVFASTQRVYVLLDGQPYGCRDLPVDMASAGPVTVTFGDVLTHSSVDFDFEVMNENVYAFHHDHMLVETRRHFDNLGYSSGAPAPAWSEMRVPCWPASPGGS